MEGINPFFIGKCIQSEGITGWMYDYYYLSESKLNNSPSVEHWKPAIVSHIAFIVFQIMCTEEFVNFSDKKLIDLI